MKSNSAHGHVEIRLTKDHVVKIDAEDFERVSNYRWHAAKIFGIYARKTPDETCSHAYMHRFIMDAKPGQIIDHRDGDTLNNTKANLRIATAQQNAFNRRRRRDSSSRFKGVMRSRDSDKKWRALIRHNGRTRHLGVFPTEKAAAYAHDLAVLALRGEFARTNFPADSVIPQRNSKQFRHLLERIEELRTT